MIDGGWERCQPRSAGAGAGGAAVVHSTLLLELVVVMEISEISWNLNRQIEGNMTKATIHKINMP